MKKIIGLIAILGAFLLAKRAFSDAPLTDYLNQPDSSFAWEVLSSEPLPNEVTLTALRLTSQTWQGIVWKHHLTVLAPKTMRKNPTALLYVTGNYHPEEALFFPALAKSLKQPVFILWDAPNQPLFDHLSEDALVSYTFQRYMETNDQTWPLLLPMTKSAHRAMDAAQSFAKREWKTTIAGFVVTGASKRGWTTWLTGATDQRVIGIAPMVYDNLNLGPQMKLQLDSWGKYSELIEDYSSKGLPELLRSAKGRKLASIVDPYTYRSRIKMPKLILTGTNDRYWSLKSASLYYDDLIGPKNILRVPNSGHGLEDRLRVYHAIEAFWGAVSVGKRLPEPAWRFKAMKDGLHLTVTSTTKPKSVVAWVAKSDTKDFRDSVWTSSPMKRQGDAFVATMKKPAKGYAAMFGEIQYQGASDPYSVSTLIEIAGAK